MTRLSVVAIILAPVVASAAGVQHFTLAASFVPPTKAGAVGAVAVTFTPKDLDVHINEVPPPRLKLDLDQKVLVDKQPAPPARVEPFDPENAKYLDLALPVTFPVALTPGAPKGQQTVKASVVYFYCSKSQGWCRKGSTDVDVPVTVP
jgi:hypothetical protein